VVDNCDKSPMMFDQKVRLTQKYTTESGEKFSVKASFGIAEFTGKGTQRDIFRLADKALYEAKEAGRNRTVVKKL
jgi:diguanylate cyclase (GGDEF)-like protein